MNEHPFKSFVQLIEFDQTIRVLTEHVETAQRESADLTNQIELLEHTQKTAAERYHTAKKNVAIHEARIKELEEAEKDRKVRLESSGNYKEYQALKAELDKVHLQQVSAERDVMQAWKEAEIAQKFLQDGQKELEEKVKSLTASLSEKLESTAKIENDIKQKMAQREAKEQGIPAEWLEKYTLMRSRVADPVVPVLREGCSVCFYSVSYQELQRLKQRALLQCKGCFRLLYMPEVMEEGVSEADSPKV